MRKNELINILSEIEGNPTIVFWNGYVDDWMHIDKRLSTQRLIKYNKKYFYTIYIFDWAQFNAGDFNNPPEDVKESALKYADEKYKNQKFCNYNGQPSIFIDKEKELVVLDAIPRNKTSMGCRDTKLEY